MNSYFIKERNMDMTYIELRLLLFIDCEEKYKKITQILNFLNNNGFISHLTMLYSEDMRAENVAERDEIMSLTIDLRDDKMRFKFWNGISTMWLFHVQDVLDALDTGREQFSELYDKYEPLTTLLYDFQKRWNTSIYRISYTYGQDDDNEVIYDIIFTQDVKDTNFASKILDKINKEIITLGKDITDNLHFTITHSYQDTGCTPCQKAREEREKQNKE